MWVTTGYDTSREITEQAREWAQKLGGRFIPRKKRSIGQLMETYGMEQLLVVSKELPKLYFRGMEKPFFFHPGTSIIRIKQLLKGDNDLLIDVAGLKEGDAFLDCTLGLGGDAIVASYVVGETGRVVGLESEKTVALLTADGLCRWQGPLPEIEQAMRRIEVIQESHLEFLRRQPDESFDIVYFDPMFRETVEESSGISGLRAVANMEPLDERAVREALRVCRRKVMMKERSNSPEFARLGFTKIHRASASVTYGVIEKRR